MDKPENPPAEIAVNVERFGDGAFLVWKLAGKQLRRKVGGVRLPHFRHGTLEAAEAEANRLVGLHPDSTFLILQEVSRAKSEARCTARTDGGE